MTAAQALPQEVGVLRVRSTPWRVAQEKMGGLGVRWLKKENNYNFVTENK